MALTGSGGNGLPAQILAVIEQKNYLETLIRKAIRPTHVFRPTVVGPMDWFQGRIGETKTFTRQALIAPSITPLNPANNTGLDNGMTAQVRSYEQWNATLNEYANFLPTNILYSEPLIADIYLDNIEAISQMGGSSIDLLCANRLFTSYDSGDTFITGSASGGDTIVNVDNVNGFDTQYPTANLPLYQVPVSVSATDKIPVAILSHTTLLITALANVQLAQADVTNVSYMQSGGVAYGRSGFLQLDASGGAFTAGDRIVALDRGASSSANPPTVGQALDPTWKDGSYVVRPLTGSPAAMITTAKAMTSATVMDPSSMIPAAVAILNRRNVPKLANGLYGCAIDSTLMASFYGDDKFARATATNWDRSPVFKDGIIAAGWGVEFTIATQVPSYTAPATGFKLRHGFVFGRDVITEHPFEGARNAASIVARVGDIADERWVDRIKIRTVSAIDTLGQVIKVAYDYTGDVVPGTDKASNPTIVLSSDYMRFKRGVILQASAPY